MSNVSQEEFNKYCAGVMGYELHSRFFSNTLYHRECKGDITGLSTYEYNYNPYEDLNQTAEVVEKLCNKESELRETFSDLVYFHKSIKQAFRNFIISTMPEAK